MYVCTRDADVDDVGVLEHNKQHSTYYFYPRTRTHKHAHARRVSRTWHRIVNILTLHIFEEFMCTYTHIYTHIFGGLCTVPFWINQNSNLRWN